MMNFSLNCTNIIHRISLKSPATTRKQTSKRQPEGCLLLSNQQPIRPEPQLRTERWPEQGAADREFQNSLPADEPAGHWHDS